MLEAALKYIEKTAHPGAKKLLTKATYLHMLALVQKEVDWYLMNGVISTAAA